MALVFLISAVVGQNALEASLNRVPERKAEWKAVITQTPKAHRFAAEYLLTHMPLSDLKALPKVQVTEAVKLSFEAQKATSWGPKVPQDIFLDSVVPYASVTEPRESMRAEFQKRYLPLVSKSKSPGEAALLINATLFKDYKVVYNTRRLRTDQSAKESIKQGMATCTGLSIMLVDALRAVGVPSRLAGIPAWPGRGGNHTWVEVWDAGKWHFVGAAEPDEKGLDHAWFAGEAGGAIASNAMNAIYAVTYKDGGARFPIVWDPGTTIYAENVTARYKKGTVVSKDPRLMVEVKKGGDRVVADVVAVQAVTGDRCFAGQSLGPQADVNLHLMGTAKEGETYRVNVQYKGQTVTREVKVAGDTVVRVDLDKDAQATNLAEVLADRFGSDKTKSEKASKMLSKEPVTEASAEKAWLAFKAVEDKELRAEFDSMTVKTSDRLSPYKWRKVGEKPKNGWGLVIAMHGGGGAPKAVNDQQWEGMFNSYYADQPEAGGYIYLALRAPNDEWNGFYDDSISPLIERMIWQFVKYAEVDPSRVYACGASHGGYGTFVIGTKIPYRFAALHPAASAPTDGETQGENLRNVRFTWAIGENDTAYGRAERCQAFAKLWDVWKAKHGGFDGGMEWIAGAGHQIGAHEKNKVAEFRKYTRIAFPKKVIWVQSDSVLKRFYWLEAVSPVDKGRIEATIEGNTVTITSEGQGDIALWFSPAMVDFSKPVKVIRDGKTTEVKLTSSLETFCEGILMTGDPELSGLARVVIKA